MRVGRSQIARRGDRRRGDRRRGGLLGRVPAPVSIVVLLVGAFLLGAGPGAGGVLLAIVLLAVGVAALRAWRLRLTRELRALERAAYTDPLTGLANRRLLVSMLDHEISRHLRHDGRFVVLMLDLDSFKQVNDEHGHDAGDAVLCSVADALSGSLRAQDTIARLGGDEFCVVAPETQDPRTLAQRVQTAVATAGGGYDQLSGSVGIALFPDDGASTEKLMRMADERLLAAKRRRHGDGRGRRDAGRVRAAA